MNLKELAVKPQLIKITLDDEEIIEEFGEALEFHVWDRQPIEKFIKFAGQKIHQDNFPEVVEFCAAMILDEEANPIMSDGKILPTSVMARCITAVFNQLGK